MDDLSYTYTNSGKSNRLQSVSDNGVATALPGVEQFVDGNTSGSDYGYDNSGNLTVDLNKGIASIQYNHLNKPTLVTFSNQDKIAYIYDAVPIAQVHPQPIGISPGSTGTKLWRTCPEACLGKVFENSTAVTKQSDYIGPFHYEDSDGDGTLVSLQLQFFSHEEGRVRWAEGYMVYETVLKDHLGNARLLFLDADENGWIDNSQGSSEVYEIDHYYPFGMRMSDGIAQGVPKVPNSYTYNGKELQDELGLGWHDYGARMYDASVGRWNGVDVLAEEYFSQGTYHFSGNNPLRFVDANGMNYGDYYTRSGRYLGNDGEDDDYVYAVDDNAVLSSPEEGSDINVILESGIEKLEISHAEFLAFASMIYHESRGDFDESHAIANTTMNFLAEGGSNQIKTLEDVVLYNNDFAYGAKQKYYSNYLKGDFRSKNDRSEISAVINALTGGPDYSVGANTWDGVDLVDTGFSNNHRNYVWNSASKILIGQNKQHVNGGVNVGGWTYAKTDFEISATRIAGKTLFTRILSGRGEGRENTRFK